MILQELLRNYILYREVLKPILGSWKESLSAGYSQKSFVTTIPNFTIALQNAKAGGDGEELGWDISDEYEAKAIGQISGTHTITKQQTLPVNKSDYLFKRKMDSGSALAGRVTSIVLVGGRVDENIVNTGETYYRGCVPMDIVTDLGTSRSVSATTGYENQQINSFLFETHEKREYLGEFSLTHEETPLLYQLRGGELT